MAGDRDSELCVLIRDSQIVEMKMNGKPFEGRHFAHELRKNLFQEHLGLSSDDSIQDPICPVVWNLWRDTARNNTRIYCEIFKDIPSDRITTFEEAREHSKTADRFLSSFWSINFFFGLFLEHHFSIWID